MNDGKQDEVEDLELVKGTEDTYQLRTTPKPDEPHNIINENNSNRTIDFGVKLLDTEAFDTEGMLSRQMGLQLVMIGAAEIQALRIKNLAVAAYRLEQKLYDPDVIENMTNPRQLLTIYQSLSMALKEAVDFVRQSNSTGWDDLRGSLEKLAAVKIATDGTQSDDNKSRALEIELVARDMLTLMQKGREEAVETEEAVAKATTSASEEDSTDEESDSTE